MTVTGPSPSIPRRSLPIVRRIPLIFSVLAAFLLVALSPHGAGARTDAEQERDQIRAEKGQVAANVDALTADKAEIDEALQALDEQLRAEEDALASAEREVAAAEEAQRKAQEGIDEAQTALAELEEQLRQQMVEAYTDPAGDSFAAVLDADSATDIVKRRAILNIQNAHDEDLSDEVKAAQDELQAQRRAAAAARVRAEETRTEVQERLTRVQQARDQQESFVEDVQERINRELARSIELAAQDKALSAQIAEEQARLQAQLAFLAHQQEAARQQAAAGPTYGDGGAESEPIAQPGPVAPAGGGTGGVPLCTAAGITVHCSIADSVQAMVAAAAADGVRLAGSGYRSPSAQISLRQQHCGSSYYAVYQMPSSQCRPPTAPPGSSQHEVGLAIDFSTYKYSWLQANASRFGFYNLPGESWHWSTTGN